MAVPGPMKYSDYCAGAAIVVGTVGSAAFVVESDPHLAALLGVATTALVALSQFLQSKGD